MAHIDPEWLRRLRSASASRPKTQFQKIRWADLQALLREHALLLEHADPETLRTLNAVRSQQPH